VEPILEVVVGKTLEQALMEVLEEEELAAIRAHEQQVTCAPKIVLMIVLSFSASTALPCASLAHSPSPVRPNARCRVG
jgi:hypothetical protein